MSVWFQNLPKSDETDAQSNLQLLKNQAFSKIPELMRGIGKGIREFNSARNSLEHELKEGMKDEPKKNTSSEA